MSAIKDGGPAFPHQDSFDTSTRPGMTLRDYFAAMALQGWLSSAPTVGGEKISSTDDHAERMARASYLFADAMLAAREVQS